MYDKNKYLRIIARFCASSETLLSLKISITQMYQIFDLWDKFSLFTALLWLLSFQMKKMGNIIAAVSIESGAGKVNI